MTTDNRTNEPKQNETKSAQEFCFTEAQVEAAAKALAQMEAGAEWDGFDVREFFMRRARAALVAAAGAAPQAESEEHPCGDYLAPCNCDNPETHDAPVLPSSTVDEDALAEVVEKAMRPIVQKDRLGTSTIYPGPKRIARAVAEWLKEQGR